jgi:hypothetical protein
MSWTASTSSIPRADLETKLKESLDSNWPEKAPGVEEQFEKAVALAKDALDFLHETELVSASLNGHVKQGDGDWGASLAVSVTAHG